MPSSSAARMTSVPLGTATSKPSMVRVTRSVGTVSAVLGEVTVTRRSLRL